jgi:NADH-quinone oxidoreductase subunit D
LAKQYNSSSFGKMPEGNEFHADVPDYYLPPKEDVYTSMESLIYHF